MSRNHICRLALLLLPLADAAASGAWTRPEGRVFLSLSSEQDRDGNRYAALYGEWGLGGRDTLGFQLDRTGAGDTGALVWLQRSLDDSTGPNRWTVSLGLGAVAREGAVLPAGQVGAAWGRGIDGPFGDGWLTVETRLNVVGVPKDAAPGQAAPPGDPGYLGNLAPRVAAKADVTLGLHLSPAMMLVNQLRFEDRQGTGFSARLSSAIVHDLAGPAKVEVGVVTPLSGVGEGALKIGTWLEF